jgi:hypothetical protein
MTLICLYNLLASMYYVHYNYYMCPNFDNKVKELQNPGSKDGMLYNQPFNNSFFDDMPKDTNEYSFYLYLVEQTLFIIVILFIPCSYFFAQ